MHTPYFLQLRDHLIGQGCSPRWKLEILLRFYWNVCGEAASLDEVAFHMGSTLAALTAALADTVDLNFHAITLRGLGVLLRPGVPQCARDLGFLVQRGGAFEVLTKEDEMRKAMTYDREILRRAYLASLGKKQ